MSDIHTTPEASPKNEAVDTATLTERAEARLWAKVDKSSDCWLWLGAKTYDGYGTITVNGVRRPTHRVVYELLVGPIFKGRELDHLCRIHNCVNPAHLEPVTTRENVLRGEGITAKNARKTHCKNGHEFTPENTIARLRASGGRMCRACNRDRMRQRRAAGLSV